MLFAEDQRHPGSIGKCIEDGDELLVLPNRERGDLSLEDLTENAIGHGPTSPWMMVEEHTLPTKTLHDGEMAPNAKSLAGDTQPWRRLSSLELIAVYTLKDLLN